MLKKTRDPNPEHFGNETSWKDQMQKAWLPNEDNSWLAVLLVCGRLPSAADFIAHYRSTSVM